MNSKHSVVYGKGLITDHDVYLFKEGSHFRLYDKLGAHVMKIDESHIPSDGTTDSSPDCRPGSSGQRGRVAVSGVYFAVWAPNAEGVFVIGDFNGWNKSSHPLAVRWDSSGIWEGFIPGLKQGTVYKYHIASKHNNYKAEKMDPFSFHCETPPKTASIVWDIDYKWDDAGWMSKRHDHNKLSAPISVYEVHLGSWRRNPQEGSRLLSYRELAPDLVKYVKEMGFTHVELLPVMEHPFYGSWGYQSLGYFAPTSRYGTPQDFMYLVDLLHQNDIGVILDWVPSHFPSDEHGLVYFDGTHLYEHSNYKEGFHPDWKSYIFNYGRCEVKNFLISSALFWMDKYHADGLRVDAVASMLYRDYSRKDGEWIPNEFGGRENLQAIDFIKCLNKTIYGAFPDAITIAEESTAWPMVTRPTSVGGLGFGLKWNMGWMHDTLCYFSKDPIYRKYHHNDLTFSMWYAFTENFALPLSHDEVVHGKGSLIGKMPADDWQKFANLKLLFGYLFTHPGKKLLFMGDEFAQRDEWNHEQSLDWHLLQYYPHQEVKRWVEDLNKLYKSEPALYELDFEQAGFDWIDHMDMEQSVISFTRKGTSSDKKILVACNFTPTPRYHYRVGVPEGGFWKEILNSDSGIYGGTNHGNFGGVEAKQEPGHGFGYSLLLTLPPLGIVIFYR